MASKNRTAPSRHGLENRLGEVIQGRSGQYSAIPAKPVQRARDVLDMAA
jgi:hypothetical protein